MRCAYLTASPHRSNEDRWYWNLNQLSIAYGFRPRLRSRLTLRGRAFLRKPWVFGGRDSHPSFRYLYRHSHFHTLQHSLRYTFNAYGTLPYPCMITNTMLTHKKACAFGNICSKLNHLSVADNFDIMYPSEIEHTVDNHATRSFGDRLEPRTFSAQDHLTSELLRTL